MFPCFFRSREPVVVERPQQRDSGSTSTAYNDTSSSTGSSRSIADPEHGFLEGDRRPRERGKSTPPPSPLFARLRRLSSNNSDPTEKPKSRLRWTACTCFILGIALIGVSVALLILEIPRHSSKPKTGVELILSRWGLPSPSAQQALTAWPTDFSRDIKPIACHSHNDYWRRVPLYDALAAGCTGVEADVWLDPNSPNDLFVGHTRKSLTSSRTLKSLYIDPLLAILNNQNAPSNFSTSTNGTAPTFPNNKTGVFDTSPTTSLTLLIDLKTPSQSTLPLVLEGIKPLLDAGHLTTYSATTGLVPGPITVVGTGNTNFSADILSPANSDPVRTIFFDAPLPSLSNDNPTTEDMLYDTTNSYYASVSFDQEIGKPFLGHMTTEQVWQARQQIAGAQRRGLVSRYWDTPSGPEAVKRGVWEVLEREGVGRLSVDDLEGVKHSLG